MNILYKTIKKIAAVARFPLTMQPLITMQRHSLDADLDFQERWGECAHLANPRISARDEMYFGVLRTYYSAGLSGLEAIEGAMKSAGIQSPQRVLDLPSGHGRVLRFLVKRFPGAHYTACDIGSDEIDFCAATFGTQSTLSQTNLEALSLGESFDLIWCGSLVTHLDIHRIEALLNFFHRHLNPGGLLVFSTHGELALQNLREGKLFNYGLSFKAAQKVLQNYSLTGFGYSDYNRSKSGYGVSFTSPSWIRSTIERVGGFREVYFAKECFGAHQDVFGVVRTADDSSS